ncbi:hypothetical protein ES703_66878 [subsurface metagenome]|nr:hypothetical protein [bacterium]
MADLRGFRFGAFKKLGQAHVAVINKKDLADSMEVSIEDLTNDIHGINPETRVVVMTARDGEGIEELIGALEL